MIRNVFFLLLKKIDTLVVSMVCTAPPLSTLGHATTNTKNRANTSNTAKHLRMSHRFDEMVAKCRSSCACAPSTLPSASPTYSSMRMAVSPCSATNVASWLKMPPSSAIVDSTCRSAPARECRYASRCGARAWVWASADAAPGPRAWRRGWLGWKEKEKERGSFF